MGLSLEINIDSNTGLNIQDKFRLRDLEFAKSKLTLKFRLHTFPGHAAYAEGWAAYAEGCAFNMLRDVDDMLRDVQHTVAAKKNASLNFLQISQQWRIGSL